jgi:hypothetical protein
MTTISTSVTTDPMITTFWNNYGSIIEKHNMLSEQSTNATGENIVNIHYDKHGDLTKICPPPQITLGNIVDVSGEFIFIKQQENTQFISHQNGQTRDYHDNMIICLQIEDGSIKPLSVIPEAQSHHIRTCVI